MGSQTSQSSSADDMFFDDFVILKKAKKPWVRKAPMISKGKKMPPARLHEGKKVSLVSSKATQEEEFQELHGKLMDFLTSVSKTKWEKNELCRRFYIFGQNITCVRWNGECYISGPEIFKVQSALYRLNHKQSVSRPKRFEEMILTQLRSLKEGEDFIIEDAGSEMIKFFYRLGAIRTHKRQKIFIWDSINHERLSGAFPVKGDTKNVPECVKPGKARKGSGYVLKSLVLFDNMPKEESGIDALISAIDSVEESFPNSIDDKGIAVKFSLS